MSRAASPLFNNETQTKITKRRRKLTVDFDVETAVSSRWNAVVGHADVDGHVIAVRFRDVESFSQNVTG